MTGLGMTTRLRGLSKLAMNILRAVDLTLFSLTESVLQVSDVIFLFPLPSLKHSFFIPIQGSLSPLL